MEMANYNKEYSYSEGFKYVVVEGNTRISCLKSGKVPNFTEESEIPVLVATKEHNETDTAFEAEILITQGIANVMVVKEWDAIAKAKHIYNLYQSKIKLGKELEEALESISTELGAKKADCKKQIQRYSIYSKVAEEDRTLTTSEWGYLEAFDINATTRDFIGLNDDMSWNDDNADGVVELIPNLIAKVGIPQIQHTKKFRDIMRKIISETNEREDVIVKINAFISGEESMSAILEHTQAATNQVAWQGKIDTAITTITNFPMNSDWSSSLLGSLVELQRKVNEGVNMIKAKGSSE